MFRYTFQISEALDAGLKALKARDGVGEGEAIRRALHAYLKARGIVVKEADDKPTRKPARRAGGGSRKTKGK